MPPNSPNLVKEINVQKDLSKPQEDKHTENHTWTHPSQTADNQR